MADRDFLILGYLENIDASLNISAFLNGHEQIAKIKMKESNVADFYNSKLVLKKVVRYTVKHQNMRLRV